MAEAGGTLEAEAGAILEAVAGAKVSIRHLGLLPSQTSVVTVQFCRRR